jgi:hypothetical protein
MKPGTHTFKAFQAVYPNDATCLANSWKCTMAGPKSCAPARSERDPAAARFTYKCAWRMCHALRKLMASADFGGLLGGDGKHVEIDERVMGGYQTC